MASLLATVGSTSFPQLTDFLLHPATLDALARLGVEHLVVQHGTHPPPATPAGPAKPPLAVHAFAYTPSLHDHLDNATVVISHAGAGSILEATSRRLPLIVVVNSALMHDHQSELACAMRDAGCCQVVSDRDIGTQLLPALASAWSPTKQRPAPAPRRHPAVLSALLADELHHATT